MKKVTLAFAGLLLIATEGLSQNVGIGTNTPTKAQLEIAGAASISKIAVSDGSNGLSINSNVPAIGFNYYLSAGNKQYANGYAGAISFSSGKMRFYTSSANVATGANPSTLFAGTAAIVIDTNRNVGMGTDFPSNFNGKLVVSKISSTSSPQVVLYDGQSNNYARLELRSGQTNVTQRFWHVAGLVYSGATSNDRLNIFHSTVGDIISVSGDNRVAIGAPVKYAAGYALSVRGKIIAEEVRVQLNGAWPDYVFSQHYPLRSIQQLDGFIRANKHLPGIPAAAQIEKEGLDIGDMQKRMMEKIEELTLYIIQQQKQIDELKQEIKPKQ